MAGVPFSDIEHHWAKASILRLVSSGWLGRGSLALFEPDAPIHRGAFAALLPWVFPATVPMQKPQRFRDVSTNHPASRAITWATQRNLLSGYPDRTFRPNEGLTRTQALISLVRGLQLQTPEDPAAILAAYFEDAAEVLLEAEGAIAAAALAGLVVSGSDLRHLRPAALLTQAELAVLLSQVLGSPEAVPPEHVTSSLTLKDIRQPKLLPLAALRGNPIVVKEIQSRLHALGLHPGEAAINGKYSARTEAALLEFCRFLELPQQQSCQLDEPLAQTLLNANPVCFALVTARDRPQVFEEFLRQEAGFSAARLAFLDRGVEGSPLAGEIATYPASFLQQPDRQSLWSFTDALRPKGAELSPMPPPPTYRPFPALGQLPQIDINGLDFLHEDIRQACVCIGSLVNGQLLTRWVGRNAIQNVQMWSATKFIPFLHLAAHINASFPNSDLDNCLVRVRRGRGFRFFDLARDVLDYQTNIASSNPIATMFKQFDTPANLEAWVQSLTGNVNLQFRGRYGSNPFIVAPEVWDEQLRRVVLRSRGTPHRGNNLISAYDLTRLITMLGWHLYLPPEGRIPHAQWNSLETIIRVMGHDSARYVDVAIARLGLINVISSPVVISKMGFGSSSKRGRTELVYTALVQFIDASHCPRTDETLPPVMQMLGLTLVAARNTTATRLDARLAAEVTEILRRLVTQELK